MYLEVTADWLSLRKEVGVAHFAKTDVVIPNKQVADNTANKLAFITFTFISLPLSIYEFAMGFKRQF